MQTPPILAELRADIDAALGAMLDRVLPRITRLHPALGPITAELRAFMAGGKRIRPALLLLGYAAGGGADRTRVLGPALALEFLHTCALMHDDVIDRASTRRGRPTVHHAFAARHRAEAWHGDADAYGEGVAILLGDLAFVHADEAFLMADVANDQLLDAFRAFCVLREEVMAGQYVDLHAATTRSTDRDLALTVATLKSGRYSVSRPLEIGARLAGADDALVTGLVAAGDPLGRAFQVRDDLLGVFGDQATTGKSVASDLREGKRTLLIAEAFLRLGPSERAELERGLGDPALSEEQAQRLRDLLDACGARAATEAYVREAVDAANTALATLAAPDHAITALRDIATYVGVRDN